MVNVSGSLPSGVVLEYRRIKTDHIVVKLNHVMPPCIVNVPFEVHAERTVVPSTSLSAVNFRSLINKSASFTKRDYLFHGTSVRIFLFVFHFLLLSVLSLQSKLKDGRKGQKSENPKKFCPYDVFLFMILNGRHGFFRRDRNALSVALRITQAEYFFKASGEYDQGLCMRIYIEKNSLYRKKTAALPAAALPFTAADRNRSRTAQNFFEICLPSVRAARRHCILPFLFYTTSLFCVYIFHA